MLPLYINMKARVTENISMKLGILKHTSCIIVGWSLHPADKQHPEAGQRVLSQQPRCSYIKFPSASFRIGDLEPGVFPLKPKKITWTLNHNTDTKIERRGFALIPDYTCTAHMVQGMTFEGLVAECGDVFGSVSL